MVMQSKRETELSVGKSLNLLFITALIGVIQAKSCSHTVLTLFLPVHETLGEASKRNALTNIHKPQDCWENQCRFGLMIHSSILAVVQVFPSLKPLIFFKVPGPQVAQ